MLIGLMGGKGHGKDTAAKRLVEKFGFQRRAFADKLYQEVAQAFGVSTDFLGNRDTKESPLPELALSRCADAEFVKVVLKTETESGALLAPRSPRFIMQRWGTEYRRQHGVDDYWLKVLEPELQSNPEGLFAITDVRFLNETSFVERHGGLLVRVVMVRLPRGTELVGKLLRSAAAPRLWLAGFLRKAAEELHLRDQAAFQVADLHPSEKELQDYQPHATLYNVYGFPFVLHTQVDEMVESLLTQREQALTAG